MTQHAYEIASLVADGIALICCICVGGAVMLTNHRPRSQRYSLYFIIAASCILGIRLLEAAFPHWCLAPLLYLVIATLPMLSLLMAESFARRHAPKGLKAAALAFSFLLFLVALIPLGDKQPIVAGTLLTISLLFTLFFVAMRDKKSLLPIENERLSTLILGFGLLIPFGASDFAPDHSNNIIGSGSIGIVCMILALIRGIGGVSSLSGYIFDLISAVLLTVIIVFISTIFGLNTPAAQIGFGLTALCLSLTLMCFYHLRGILKQRLVTPLAVYLADARQDTLDTFIADLRGHKLLKESRLFDMIALSEKAAPEMLDLLATNPVQSRPSLEKVQAKFSLSRGEEAALSFLIEQEMTHVVSLRTAPPVVLICEGIASSTDKVEAASLVLLSKLARQIG